MRGERCSPLERGSSTLGEQGCVLKMLKSGKGILNIEQGILNIEGLTRRLTSSLDIKIRNSVNQQTA